MIKWLRWSGSTFIEWKVHAFNQNNDHMLFLSKERPVVRTFQLVSSLIWISSIHSQRLSSFVISEDCNFQWHLLLNSNHLTPNNTLIFQWKMTHRKRNFRRKIFFCLSQKGKSGIAKLGKIFPAKTFSINFVLFNNTFSISLFWLVEMTILWHSDRSCPPLASHNPWCCCHWWDNNGHLTVHSHWDVVDLRCFLIFIWNELFENFIVLFNHIYVLALLNFYQ